MTNKYVYDVITGTETGPVARILKAALFPLSLFYWLGVIITDQCYRNKVSLSTRLSRPVISVGNIAAGGTGKTPFVIFLANYFRNKKWHPVILTRGYMDKKDAPSDEADLMKRILVDVPIYVSPDRIASAKKAMTETPRPDIFIMDDGFQHRKVARNLDIVLLDATNPFGEDEWLLPYGILRETPAALRRADIVVLTRTDQAGSAKLAELRTELIRINANVQILETIHEPTGLQKLSSAGWATVPFEELKVPALALSAIGTPGSFAGSLQRLGAAVLRHESFPDHHVYSVRNVARVVKLCRSLNVDRLITTQKDAVKLERFYDAFKDIQVLALAIEIKITRGEHELRLRLDNIRYS